MYIIMQINCPLCFGHIDSLAISYRLSDEKHDLNTSLISYESQSFQQTLASNETLEYHKIIYWSNLIVNTAAMRRKIKYSSLFYYYFKNFTRYHVNNSEHKIDIVFFRILRNTKVLHSACNILDYF